MVKITKSLSSMASAACLSTMLFMSSCSKDDAAMPSPEATVTNDGSNLKTNFVGSGFGLSAIIPATNCTTKGYNTFPSGWAQHIDSSPYTVSKYPSGTSTLVNLWGEPVTPWIKPLEAPYENAGNKIVTFVHQRNTIVENSTRAKVKTQIKNLVPGAKYSVTFYFASTVRQYNGKPTQYSNGGVFVEIGSAVYTKVNLIGKEAEWVKKTIEFVAEAPEVNVFMMGYREGDSSGEEAVKAKFLVYNNVFVGNDAVKKIN